MLACMSRSPEKRAPRLVEDGRGYHTPLQEYGDNALEFLRKDVARLPQRPRHPARRLRKLHEQRPAPRYSRRPSVAITALHILLGAIVVGFAAFSVLAYAGRWIAPDLAPLPTGIVPFGTRVLLAFALYAGTGLTAGCGTAYWLLRQNQH